MRIAAAIAIFFSAALPAAAQSAGAPLAFRDWTVTCRSDGFCAATTVADGDAHVLSIGRHAEETYWELSFAARAAKADADAPVAIAVDDVSEVFAGPAEVAAYGASGNLYFLGSKAQAVMDRLMPASAASVAYADRDGLRQRIGFSLAGLTASLIWIDEWQGRLGSERVAGVPPVGLVPPLDGPAAGELAATALPADVTSAHAARTDLFCTPVEDLGSSAFSHPLPDGSGLFLVPCEDGTYNTYYAAYLADAEDVQPLRFAALQAEGGWAVEHGLWNPEFDPAAGTLDSYRLDRSRGDCGITARYVWERQRFVLIRTALKADCDGNADLTGFPVVYERR